MKGVVRFLLIVTLAVGCFVFGQPQAQALNLGPVAALNAADAKLTTEFGQKIDLNNSDIRDFRDLRGFYPNLAGKIIKNAPYEQVEDVLDIPGLSSGQKERLQANIDKFTVTPPAKEFIEGDDRFNPGVY
jgi:photosystem II PsbU protein